MGFHFFSKNIYETSSRCLANFKLWIYKYVSIANCKFFILCIQPEICRRKKAKDMTVAVETSCFRSKHLSLKCDPMETTKDLRITLNQSDKWDAKLFIMTVKNKESERNRRRQRQVDIYLISPSGSFFTFSARTISAFVPKVVCCWWTIWIEF